MLKYENNTKQGRLWYNFVLKKLGGILIIFVLGVAGFFTWAWQDYKTFCHSTVPIFAYHCVEKGDSIYMTAPEELDMQMKYLHDKGYKTISMGEYAEARRTGKTLDKCMIVTFDDGYKDNVQNGAPVLARYGYTGTVFMAVKYIGADKYLNWEDIGTLKKYGWEIGSHTYNHIKLKEAKPNKVREELTKSKYVLEHGPVPLKVTSFCYPYGSTSNTLSNMVKEAGYTSALTCEMGTDTNKTPIYELKRIAVFNYNMSKEIFTRSMREAFVLGWLDSKGIPMGDYWIKWRNKTMASWKEISAGHLLSSLCKIFKYPAGDAEN